MSELRDAVFRDIATSIRVWTDTALTEIAQKDQAPWWEDDQESWQDFSTAIDGPERRAQFERLVEHLLRGLAHSLLATVDGASASAEVGRIHLTGPDGQSIGEGLHELFEGFLET
jgi:hypothetical protein